MFDTVFPVLFCRQEAREESLNHTTAVSEMLLVCIHSQWPEMISLWYSRRVLRAEEQTFPLRPEVCLGFSLGDESCDLYVVFLNIKNNLQHLVSDLWDIKWLSLEKNEFGFSLLLIRFWPPNIHLVNPCIDPNAQFGNYFPAVGLRVIVLFLYGFASSCLSSVWILHMPPSFIPHVTVSTHQANNILCFVFFTFKFSSLRSYRTVRRWILSAPSAQMCSFPWVFELHCEKFLSVPSFNLRWGCMIGTLNRCRVTTPVHEEWTKHVKHS